MTTLLSLDISTSCTGFAVFATDTGKLLRSGRIKPQVPGLHKLRYPKAALMTILDMASKIKCLVDQVKPSRVVIEEVNRGISRLGQKSLDACHFFVLFEMHNLDPTYLDRLVYIDSNGKKGWRGILGLKLSDQDKQVNAELREKNRKRRKSQKAPLIDWKILAQRWVNKKHRTSYNVWENPGDNDECDAICVGEAWLILNRNQ